MLNIKVIKCFRHVFNKSIAKNYGFFIILFIIVLFIVCMSIFYIKSFNILKNDINNIVIALKDKNKLSSKKIIIVKRARNKNKTFKYSSSKINLTNIYALNNNIEITRKNIQNSQSNNGDETTKKIKFQDEPKNKN